MKNLPSSTSRPYTGVETHAHSSASTGGNTLSPATFTPTGDVELASTKTIILQNGANKTILKNYGGADWLAVRNNDDSAYTAISVSGVEVVTSGTVDGVDISTVFALGKKYVIGDTALQSHDAEATGNVNQATYELKKTITLNTLFLTPSTIRVKFDLKTSDGAQTAYGRIYKNGGAVGTERTSVNVAGFDTFSEDISFADNDTVELYTKCPGASGATATVRNFRITGSESDITTLDEAINNGDIVADPFDAANS